MTTSTQRSSTASDAGLPVCVSRMASEMFGRSKSATTTSGTHPQAARDVRLNGRGGRRRQREDRRPAELADRVDQPQVLEPELLAPLAHEMRLVADEQPDVT